MRVPTLKYGGGYSDTLYFDNVMDWIKIGIRRVVGRNR